MIRTRAEPVRLREKEEGQMILLYKSFHRHMTKVSCKFISVAFLLLFVCLFFADGPIHG